MPERAGHGKRDPNDYYATTPAMARRICEVIQRDYAMSPSSILEPGCGAGTFLGAIRATWPAARLRGIEVHADLAEWSQKLGFDVVLSDLLANDWGRYDLIIGNPPFSLSEGFIRHLRTHLAPGGLLVLLLRLNFLESQDRFREFWPDFPPSHIYVSPHRPGFTPDGKTDGTGYGVYVWTAERLNAGRGAIDILAGPSRALTTLSWLDTEGVQVRWNGRPATETRAAVLDPEYPDPRRDLPTPRAARVTPGASLLEYPPSLAPSDGAAAEPVLRREG